MIVFAAFPSLSLYLANRAKHDEKDARSKTKVQVPGTGVDADDEPFPSVTASATPESTVSGQHTPHSRDGQCTGWWARGM